jgi:hypothetical protein
MKQRKLVLKLWAACRKAERTSRDHPEYIKRQTQIIDLILKLNKRNLASLLTLELVPMLKKTMQEEDDELRDCFEDLATMLSADQPCPE